MVFYVLRAEIDKKKDSVRLEGINETGQYEARHEKEWRARMNAVLEIPRHIKDKKQYVANIVQKIGNIDYVEDAHSAWKNIKGEMMQVIEFKASPKHIESAVRDVYHAMKKKYDAIAEVYLDGNGKLQESTLIPIFLNDMQGKYELYKGEFENFCFDIETPTRDETGKETYAKPGEKEILVISYLSTLLEDAKVLGHGFDTDLPDVVVDDSERDMLETLMNSLNNTLDASQKNKDGKALALITYNGNGFDNPAINRRKGKYAKRKKDHLDFKVGKKPVKYKQCGTGIGKKGGYLTPFGFVNIDAWNLLKYADFETSKLKKVVYYLFNIRLPELGGEISDYLNSDDKKSRDTALTYSLNDVVYLQKVWNELKLGELAVLMSDTLGQPIEKAITRSNRDQAYCATLKQTFGKGWAAKTKPLPTKGQQYSFGDKDFSGIRSVGRFKAKFDTLTDVYGETLKEIIGDNPIIDAIKDAKERRGKAKTDLEKAFLDKLTNNLFRYAQALDNPFISEDGSRKLAKDGKTVFYNKLNERKHSAVYYHQNTAIREDPLSDQHVIVFKKDKKGREFGYITVDENDNIKSKGIRTYDSSVSNYENAVIGHVLRDTVLDGFDAGLETLSHYMKTMKRELEIDQKQFERKEVVRKPVTNIMHSKKRARAEDNDSSIGDLHRFVPEEEIIKNTLFSRLENVFAAGKYENKLKDTIYVVSDTQQTSLDKFPAVEKETIAVKAPKSSQQKLSSFF